MNSRDKNILEVVQTAEDILAGYRTHATNGIHPVLRSRIENLITISTSVLDQSHLLFGQQVVLREND